MAGADGPGCGLDGVVGRGLEGCGCGCVIARAKPPRKRRRNPPLATVDHSGRWCADQTGCYTEMTDRPFGVTWSVEAPGLARSGASPFNDHDGFRSSLMGRA
jgi:hypothetical protein